MTIGIHQPNLFPHGGYFDKMSKCDVFVILDSVQYEKDSYTNRVKIKTPKGAEWITFSIKNNHPQLIKDVKFADFSIDRDRILKTLELNYKKASGFDTVFPILENIMGGTWESLSGFNIHALYDLSIGLRNKPRIEIASMYDFKGSSTDLLIEICKEFKADTYLSGCGAKDYQEEKKFKQAGIKLEYNVFREKIYKQQWGEFIPGLSIIDQLLCGEYSNN